MDSRFQWAQLGHRVIIRTLCENQHLTEQLCACSRFDSIKTLSITSGIIVSCDSHSIIVLLEAILSNDKEQRLYTFCSSEPRLHEIDLDDTVELAADQPSEWELLVHWNSLVRESGKSLQSR